MNDYLIYTPWIFVIVLTLILLFIAFEFASRSTYNYSFTLSLLNKPIVRENVKRILPKGWTIMEIGHIRKDMFGDLSCYVGVINHRKRLFTNDSILLNRDMTIKSEHLLKNIEFWTGGRN